MTLGFYFTVFTVEQLTDLDLCCERGCLGVSRLNAEDWLCRIDDSVLLCLSWHAQQNRGCLRMLCFAISQSCCHETVSCLSIEEVVSGHRKYKTDIRGDDTVRFIYSMSPMNCQ